MDCKHIIACAVTTAQKEQAMRLRREGRTTLAMAMLTGPCTKEWHETLNGKIVKR